MGLAEEETHVSLFTRDQCRQAIKILRPKYIQLYGQDLEYKKKEKVPVNDIRVTALLTILPFFVLKTPFS